MIKNLFVALMIVISCSILLAKDGYTTYADLTVWVERENELGFKETIQIDHIVSKTIKGNKTELRYMEPYRSMVTIYEPKEKIIKEYEASDSYYKEKE